MVNCEYCGCKFETTHGLNTHKSMVHDANIVSCFSCESNFKKALNKIERDDRHFCSNDCKNVWMSSLTGEDSFSWRGGPVEKDCEFCGKHYSVKESRSDNSRFCSMDCMALWKSENWRGSDCPNWNGGHQKSYGPRWNSIRKDVRKRDECCRLCEMSIEEHKNKYGRNPDIHHIKPIKSFDSFEQANRKENLVMLCRDCHSKVESGEKEIESTEPSR